MKQRWVVLILILAGFIAYGNTLKNGLFWDDDEFITRNAYIRSFRYLPQWFSQPLTAGAGINSNYYRPLLMASFTVDYHLWGLWPVGYHLENMFWHIAAGILLFVFLSMLISVVSSAVERPSVSDINNPIASLDSSTPSRLRRDSARNDGAIEKLIAFSTALLWLIHPAHVEAVAYANSRGDSMATVFILLSLILWMKNKIKGSAIAFILALLSKEFAIVTPGLVLLMEATKNFQFSIFPAERDPASQDNFQSNSKNQLSKSKFLLIGNLNFIGAWSLKIGFFIAIAAIYVLLRLTTLNFQNTLNFYGVDMTKVDQTQPLTRYATSLPVRLMTFLKVLPIYAGILIWPNDLHMERTVEIATTAADKTVIIVTTVVIATLLNCYIAVRKKSFLIPFAVGWFFISILPVSGVIPISQILAEHFLYLPSIGFFLLISWLLLLTISFFPISSRFRLAIFFSLIALISLILLNKTISQNRVWRDPITFYEYTLTKTKPTARVYNNLAMAYAETKEHQKAINNYQLAISLGDVYPNPHYNLGNTFIEIGETEKAEDEYKKALKIDPGFHYATLKLGQIYINQGKVDDAKKLVCPVFPAQPLCL